MTIAFVNVGTVGSGAASVAPGIPASVVAGDVLILLVETCAQSPSLGGTWPPAGWSTFDFSGASGVDGGLGAAMAGSTGLYPAYKFATGSDVAPTVPDSGDHQFAQIIAYRGVDQDFPFEQYRGNSSGTVSNASSDNSASAAASTTLSWPTRIVQGANRLVLLIAALGLDAASSATSSGYANASLSGITERIDQTITTGFGGGLCVVEGTTSAGGTIAATTGTVTSCTKTYAIIVLRPAATPTLSSPGATSITTTTATPQVTLAY